MGNKGFINRAKSGQKALSARLSRIKSQARTQPRARRRPGRVRRDK